MPAGLRQQWRTQQAQIDSSGDGVVGEKPLFGEEYYRKQAGNAMRDVLFKDDVNMLMQPDSDNPIMNKPKSLYVTSKIGNKHLYNRKQSDSSHRKVDSHSLPPAGVHSRFYSVIKSGQDMKEKGAAVDALLSPMYDESPDLFGVDGAAPLDVIG